MARLSEKWIDIPGYEGYYQVSNIGNVKSGERKTHKKYRWSFYDGSVIKCG